jgi:hypothetical protein
LKCLREMISSKMEVVREKKNITTHRSAPSQTPIRSVTVFVGRGPKAKGHPRTPLQSPVRARFFGLRVSAKRLCRRACPFGASAFDSFYSDEGLSRAPHSGLSVLRAILYERFRPSRGNSHSGRPARQRTRQRFSQPSQPRFSQREVARDRVWEECYTLSEITGHSGAEKINRICSARNFYD